MSTAGDVEGSKDYAVGYGKPPVATRFQPGQSGNPRGRRNGVRNFSTEVKEIAAMPVVVTERGKRRKITSLRASMLKLREQALNGNQRALEKYLALMAQYDDEPAPASAISSHEDEAILAGYTARIIAEHKAQQAGSSDTNETVPSAATEKTLLAL